MVQTRSRTLNNNSKKVVNPNKYVKNTVSKSRYSVQFEEDSCNITHYRENNRIVTVAFHYNSKNETIRYGATIYQKDPEEPWNKKDHVATARNRFHTCPVELVHFSPEFGHFREFLRKQLFSFGVHGDRQ